MLKNNGGVCLGNDKQRVFAINRILAETPEIAASEFIAASNLLIKGRPDERKQTKSSGETKILHNRVLCCAWD